MRIYVWNIKLSIAWSIESPRAVVAHNSFAVSGDFSWDSRMICWFLSWPVSSSITYIIHPVTRPIADLKLRMENCSSWAGMLLYILSTISIWITPIVALRTVIWIDMKLCVLTIFWSRLPRYS